MEYTIQILIICTIILYTNYHIMPVKMIIRYLELEVNLFVFRILKISEYIKMYKKWWVFVGKKIRDDYYNIWKPPEALLD